MVGILLLSLNLPLHKSDKCNVKIETTRSSEGLMMLRPNSKVDNQSHMCNHKNLITCVFHIFANYSNLPNIILYNFALKGS